MTSPAVLERIIALAVFCVRLGFSVFGGIFTYVLCTHVDYYMYVSITV